MPTDQPEPKRLHHLDAIRVSAILLLIPYHAARYLQKGDSDSRLLDGWVWFLHTWHLPLFFAISGFLAASALARSDAAGQVRSRLKRLGLPLAIGLVTVVPLANLMVIGSAQLRARSEGLPKSRDLQLDHIFTTAPRHLWFIEYLLMLSLLGILAWWLLRHAPAAARLGDRLGALIASPLAIFPLAIVGALILSTKSGWAPGGGAADSIAPNPTLLAYYGLFFGAGWLLSRRETLLAGLERGARTRLLFGFALSLVGFVLFYDSGTFTGIRGWDGRLVGDPGLRLAGLFCFGLVGWSMLLGIWGTLSARVRSPSRAMRYLSDASFWVYLVHIPFLVGVQSSLAETGLPAELRYPLTIAGTLMLALGTYALFVRRSMIGRFLHGPRPRHRRAGGAATATA